MSLAIFAAAFSDPGEHRQQLWQTIAFLGRYGHQPLSEVIGLPLNESRELMQAVADLLIEEKKGLPSEGEE